MHPVFSFVGFWLVGIGLLMWSATALGVDTKNPHILTNTVVYGAPVILAVIFRKVVPQIMKWILIIGGSALLIWMIIDLAIFLKNR